MANNVPTIPGTSQVPDVQIGAKRNPQPRIQALAGVRRVAQAAEGSIDSAMSVVAEYEEKKRKAEEAYVFNSSSLSFQKLHQDYLHNVKKIPDEQIVPGWTGATQAWKQQQLDQYGGKLSPRAKRVFEMNMDSAIGGSTAKFQVVADSLGSQRRESAAVANWDEFLKTGDPGMAAKAEGALRLAVRAGDMTQDKMDFYTSQIKPTLQKNQILNGIDNDAFATLKSIDEGKYPSVSEKDISTLRNAAEKQVNFVQRTTAGDAINDFATSGIPKTKEELRQLKDTGKVTGEFVRGYNAMVDRSEYKEAENKQALMLNKLRDLDLTDSDNPEKDVREITDQSASLPPQLQKEIHTLAASRIKSAKTATEKTVHAGQLDLMRQSFDESQARILIAHSADGNPARWAESAESIEEMPQEKLEATFGEDADRASLVKTAKAVATSDRLRYARAQKAYVEWSHTKKGAEASPQDADAERERLGFGRYTSTDDVAAAYKAGKVDRGTAKEILRRQFGIP